MDLVRSKFEEVLLRHWPNAIIEVLDEELGKSFDLFFARDQGMYDLYEEYAYTLNPDGESCFMLGAFQRDRFERRVEVQAYTKNDGIGVDPFNAHLFFSHVWQYGLVTPNVPEDCAFSKLLYEMLVSALDEARINRHVLHERGKSSCTALLA